jgi:DNA-binding transcriptional ArsR family regulator
MKKSPHDHVYFDGATYKPQFDRARLTGQIKRVFDLMSDGRWRTLDEIQMVVGGSQPAISARLRDLRKARYGSLQVDRKHRPSVSKMRGLYEYRLVLGRGVKRTT